jgi:predicted metal-dependent HD superfamily phosphohydrolase
MSTDVELRAAWQAHVHPDADLLDRLLGRHRERHRRYHGTAHVRWVVRHVLELATVEPVDDLDAVVAAAFYHDAVYEPKHPANERASARLARRDLAALGSPVPWDETRIGSVAAMIEGTATHLDPPDVDTAVLFDADLAVLGADVVGYDAYVTGVRAEYRHVADDDWRAGRAAVLEAFLERPAIYATDSGRRRWEARARANITGELAMLAADDG